jgi:MFS family permease
MKIAYNRSFLYSLFVITLSSLFLFYKYILQVSPGIMTNELEQTFSLHAAQMGNLAAAYYYSYVIMQIFAGPIIDRFNPGRVTAFAVLLCSVGSFLFGWADNIILALTARGLMGIGVAFATVSYIKMTSIYFKPERFAFITGLLATAAMAGAIFGETPLVLLMAHTGWRGLLYIVGIFGAVLALIFYVGVHGKNTKALVSEQPRLSDLKKVLLNKQNILLTIYSGFAFAPLAVLGGLWANPFFQTVYHMTLVQSSLIVSLMFLGFGIGSPVLGWLSDRFNKRLKVMKVSAAIAFISLFLIISFPHISELMLSILLFLFGFFTGALLLGFTLGKESNPIFLAATITALINTGDEFLTGISEPIVGKALDLHWNGAIVNGVQQFTPNDFHFAFLLMPLYVAISFVTLFWIHEKNN